MRRRLLVGATVAATVVGCTSAGIVRSTAGTIVPGPPTTTVVQTGASNGLYAIAGTYALLAVDGHTLPYSPPAKDAGTASTQILSGTLTLSINGTFALTTSYRALDNSGEQKFEGQFTGACARDGDDYRLFWEGGGETAMKASGDTLTVDREGVLFRYLKRR
jgi:hypothetical protein